MAFITVLTKIHNSPLLVAADGRRRRAAEATEGEEQDSRHQVPPEEKGAYREPGAGG